MKAQKIDGFKLKEAIGKFGSLDKAVENLKYQQATLNKEVIGLKKEKEGLNQIKEKLLVDINDLKNQCGEQKNKLEALVHTFGEWERQYNLFQGFLAMLVGSPSVTSCLESLISVLQQLVGTGWAVTKKADDLKSHFVHAIMGDYLKCFHCKECGAKFIVNKQPRYESIANFYQCPSCHTPYGVEPDDSFLKAMVSEAQLDNVIIIEKVLKEKKALEPLAPFLDVVCEICGKPITEWDKQNVQAAIKGWGWGHHKCWNTDLGQVKLMMKLNDIIY